MSKIPGKCLKFQKFHDFLDTPALNAGLFRQNCTEFNENDTFSLVFHCFKHIRFSLGIYRFLPKMGKLLIFHENRSKKVVEKWSISEKTVKNSENGQNSEKPALNTVRF